MKGALKKTPYGFVPADAEAQKMYDKMAMGELCMGEKVRGRNYENHGRFFWFRDVTFDIQDSFEDNELWRKQLHILGGHFEEVIVPTPDWLEWVLKYMDKYLDGPHKKKVIEKITKSYGVQFWPKSIAWEKMDEIEFQDFFKRAVGGFLKNYAPYMTEEEFMRVLDFD